VEDLLVVGVFDGEANLSEPVQHLILGEELHSTRGVFNFGLRFDFGLQVTIVTVVHHDAKFAFFSFVNFSEAGDIRVVQNLEDLCFLQGFFSLLFVHFSNVDLLDNGLGFIRLALD
jgi:hypothetical protein